MHIIKRNRGRYSSIIGTTTLPQEPRFARNPPSPLVPLYGGPNGLRVLLPVLPDAVDEVDVLLLGPLGVPLSNAGKVGVRVVGVVHALEEPLYGELR